MSQYTAELKPVLRHPLGMAPGSIRALLALAISILFWLALILPEDRIAHIPIIFYGLLGLVMIFFVSIGQSNIPEGVYVQPAPLGLPKGVVQLLIIAGFVAVIGYQYYYHEEALIKRLKPEEGKLWQIPYVFFWMAGGFLVGYIVGRGPWRRNAWFQDIHAWLSIVAGFAFTILFVLHIIIMPTLHEEIDVFTFECVLSAIIAYYFGFRS